MGTTSRAGRDLGAAIGVGLGLGGITLLSLLTYRPAFVLVVALAVVVAVGELAAALRAGGLHVPALPLLVGTPLVPILGYAGHGRAPLVAFLTLMFVVASWRIVQAVRAGGFHGDGVVTRDLAAGIFACVYVPFLSLFVTLVLAQPEGDLRVVTWLSCVVASDVGGYAVGVATGGRHKLVPLVSPGKSWEGLAGSVALAALTGVLLMSQCLGEPGWKGLVLGSAVALASALGDLLESAVKRDLGIKDMGSLLPGHGGLLDRLDSVLVAAPVAWGVLGVLL
jgi:phosphatidate cytidylyltransferase